MDGSKTVKGAPGKPGAIVHLRCTVDRGGKPCNAPSVERTPPFRCSGHLYVAEYPDASAEARRPARRPRALPLQRETLI